VLYREPKLLKDGNLFERAERTALFQCSTVSRNC